MADLKPRMTAVHDGHGRLAIYIDESVGRDAVLSHFGPRYQQIIVHGEPCAIFFDKNMRYFCIAPVFYKQDLMSRPGRYDYITDLDWLPTAGAAGNSGNAGGPAVNADPADSFGRFAAATAQFEIDNERNGGDGEEAMDLDGQVQATAGSPQSAEKIPRPPNSWILFRKEKSKELREANPGMSAGEVSTEAARQWKAMSDEGKGFYQDLAKAAAEQHKIQYPEYRYKPARK